jgi:hypothetical protein
MRGRKLIEAMREKLLRELNDEVATRFGGHKTNAAMAARMHRVQFTNICNGKEDASIEKLAEIGIRFGWKIDIDVQRKKGR